MVEHTNNRVKIFPESVSSTAALGRIPRGLGGANLFRCDGQTELCPRCDIIFPQSLYQQVVGHLAEDTTREHGGFLLGYEKPATEQGVPTVVVTDAIAAQHTEGSPVRLTFTTETWRDLDRQMSEKYQDPADAPQRIGWYHSHPDMAIFLSHYDLDVCKTYDRKKTPIALVVDPVKNNGGFFVRGKDGYQPRSPQGFYELRDLQSETMVTWKNMVAVDPPAGTEGEQEQDHPARLSQVILAVALLCMATAIAVLWVKQQGVQKTMNAMATEIHGLASSGKENAAVTTSPVPQVSVSPGQVNLLAKQKQQFEALVRGFDNQGVTWSRTPVIGMMSSTGLYTAPARIPKETVVTVKATSTADPATFATADLTLGAASPVQAISLNVTQATLRPSESKHFIAKSALPGKPGRFIWSIDPAGQGSINDGVYTAPSAIPAETTIVVKAASQADADNFATATVTLKPGSQPTVSTPPAAGLPSDAGGATEPPTDPQ